MHEIIDDGDLFTYPQDITDAVCVTTNGCINSKGYAIMGKGIALSAKELFPNIEIKLGRLLKHNGNHAFDCGVYQTHILDTDQMYHVFTMPTKNNWKDKSNIELIRQSAEELVKLCDENGIKRCFLPCPGCTNGQLDYQNDVRPVLLNILDDRFVIIGGSDKIKTTSLAGEREDNDDRTI